MLHEPQDGQGAAHDGVAAIVAQAGALAEPPAFSMASASVLTRAGLPSVEVAEASLSASLAGTRHPQWIDIPVGSSTVRSFVVFPDREDSSAPVVVLTANNQGMSDWLRAVGDDAAKAGFVAIVPDLLTGMGPNGGGTDAFANPDAIVRAMTAQRSEIARRSAAVDQFALGMPGSNGRAATVHFRFGDGSGRIETTLAPSSPRTFAPRTFAPRTSHLWVPDRPAPPRLENVAAEPSARQHLRLQHRRGARRKHDPFRARPAGWRGRCRRGARLYF